MPTFKGTKKEWRIILRAICHLGDSMVFNKENIPDEWNDMTMDEIQNLYTEIQYEMEDK